MSLNRFKETLLRCSAGAGAGAGSDSSSFEPSFASTSLLRKPPKTSLSQQLQRLDDPQFGVKKESKKEAAEEEQEEEEESSASRGNGVASLADQQVKESISLEPSGPYEPLVLSHPGEIPLIQVPASINCRLLEHQRHGVRFLYELYRKNHGGVLGDDMGLGKTIQTIAFLVAVIGKNIEREFHGTNHTIKKGPVLIMCPTSVIQNWKDEFSKWGELNVAIYHGPNRELVIDKLESHSTEVLITSFDTFRNHDKILCGIPWEIVIVDEAHRLKNEKSRLYQSCVGIKTRKKFGLTGTVMQNRILELFNLFDWVAPGCLGTWEHFRDFYDEPLKHGQRVNAPERFVQIANERKKHLAVVLQKYLLRRTKEETIGHLMLGKEDNVVFCAMSELQKRVYKKMLELPDVQCLINKDLPCSCGSPLTQVECCKRTVPNGIIWSYLHRDNPDGCDSCPFCLVLPCLIKLQQISNHLELIKPNPKDDLEKQKKDAELVSAIFGNDIELVGGCAPTEDFIWLSDVEHCGKMRALEKLMLSWTSKGDKILLFSYSVRMLDILEKFLIRKGYCFSRLDGSTPMNSRQSLVDEFNKSPSKQVFLISTRAGGLGINLVSANRVVIFDPNWNPAQDLQAQDRSFRYGQKRHVVVFRLLAAGSLEELVYSRQVYKQQLSHIAVSGKMEKRYFQGVQDCKEFQGELFGISNLFRDLSDKLFTSEIIKIHDQKDKSTESQNKVVNLVNDDNISLMDEHQVSCSGRPLEDATSTDNANRLHDCGIVYAHRNEDVVNMGSGLSEKSISCVAVDDCAAKATKMSINPVGICSVIINHNKIVHTTEDQKKDGFRRIALYMGMEELEFSKWILSASPSELADILYKYKRRQKRKR